MWFVAKVFFLNALFDGRLLLEEHPPSPILFHLYEQRWERAAIYPSLSSTVALHLYCISQSLGSARRLFSGFHRHRRLARTETFFPTKQRNSPKPLAADTFQRYSEPPKYLKNAEKGRGNLSSFWAIREQMWGSEPLASPVLSCRGIHVKILPPPAALLFLH